MQTLFGWGLRLISYPITGSPSGLLTIGTPVTGTATGPGHPASDLNDGNKALYCAANEVTAAPTVALSAMAINPHFAAFFNTNIDASAICRLQASSGATFIPMTLDIPVTGAEDFWVDLRATASSGMYYRLSVSGNAEPVRVGEMVVGYVEGIQTYQWGYEEIDDYLERFQGAGPFGRLVRQKRGITVRSRDRIVFVGQDSSVDLIRKITVEQWTCPWPVVFIPSDEEADVWLVEWPVAPLMKTITDHRTEHTIFLQGQSPGVV